MTEAEARARLESMLDVDGDPALSSAEVDRLLRGARRIDEDGREPQDVDWEPTFDLNWAAAEGWGIKAGKAARFFSFTADGSSVQKGDVHQNCLKMEKKYRGRINTSALIGSALGTVAEEQVP